MSERTNLMSRDRSTIAGGVEATQPVSVTLLDGGTRFVLRLAPTAAATVRQAGGFDLTAKLNSATTQGLLTSARIGPDEWLLIAPDGQSEALTQSIESALVGQVHSLVDVSHRNVGIVVAGREAPTVLNAGVLIDLSDAAFPAGSATRTILGKAEIVLIRAGSEPVYRVECWRSFAPYVHAFLEEAAREFAAR